MERLANDKTYETYLSVWKFLSRVRLPKLIKPWLTKKRIGK